MPRLGTAALLFGAAASLAATHPQAPQRGLVSPGDPARLRSALHRARGGQPVVIGVIGGSITQGAAASEPERRWPNLVAAWWRRSFPGTPVELVNAGLGGTGSAIGAHRVQADLLARQPDLVVVEFAVNDASPALAEPLEGLLRQILRQPRGPAVLMLFLMNERGESAEPWQAPLASHYGLPQVSLRAALWPEIQAGRSRWSDVGADAVHLNDRGHAASAELVTRLLQENLVALQAGAKPARPAALPRPLFSDVFERTSVGTPASLAPLTNRGFSVASDLGHGFDQGWTAREPGGLLEFELEGTLVSLVFTRGQSWGVAEIVVDGRPGTRLDASYDQVDLPTWALAGRELGPGKHRLTIRSLDEKPSFGMGRGFQVRAVLGAGLPEAGR